MKVKHKSFHECEYTEYNMELDRTIAIFNYTGDINCHLEFDNNRGRTWRFIINKDFKELLTKRGFPRIKVQGFIYEILNYENTEWVLAEYKDLIALRNPADRTTTIYPKWYWEDRTGSRFNNINIVNLNEEAVR